MAAERPTKHMIEESKLEHLMTQSNNTSSNFVTEQPIAVGLITEQNNWILANIFIENYSYVKMH